MPDERLEAKPSRNAKVADKNNFDFDAPASALRAIRAAAGDIAKRALEERGFVLQSSHDGRWLGTLALRRSGLTVDVEVRLPDNFPDALPKVAVTPARVGRRIAHVEVSGTVCVVPSSNVLLDSDRPDAIVAEALDRAADVLDRGMLGESDAELDAEFQAYWIATDATRVLSICDAEAPARTIVMCQVRGGSKLLDEALLLADSAQDAERWTENVGAKIGSSGNALFVVVSVSAPLAAADQATTLSEISQLILRQGTPLSARLFRDVIERSDYPQLIVLSMPERGTGAGRTLIAVTVRKPDPELLKAAAHGFRRGRVPAGRVLNWIGRSVVGRQLLRRVDHTFLTVRGGSAPRLASSTVAIVGIGAVGSEIARNLAAMGVGHLRLVDHELVEPENVHRHVLGMRSTGYSKAAAMSVELASNFPHLKIDSRIARVEDLLRDDPAFILESDLIVLSTGDETLERRLNRLLLNGPPRLHVWLEPLGVAGHAFACGVHLSTLARNLGKDASRGCFECLYRPDPEYGLINRTALTAAGQEIRRSFGGCAGTFFPFSPLDARRTSLDAADLAARMLGGMVNTPTLMSWRGMRSDFEIANYKLSPRASQIAPGARVELSGSEIWREHCLVCGDQGPTVTART